MKLLRQLIDGNIFVDETTSGIFPHKFSETVESGWEDITSIENIDMYGFSRTDEDYYTVANYLRQLIEEIGYSNLTPEQQVVSNKHLVYKLTGKKDSVEDLDYDLYGLHKKKILVQGELIEVEYYKNFDGTTYSELVVKETRVYFRPQMGLVYTRTMNINWYMSDGSIGYSKTGIVKYYSNQEAMDEAEIRRHNVLSDAKLYITSEVGVVDALDLMSSVNNEISLYIQGLQQPLLDGIAASTKPYLTQLMKDTLVPILTIND
jgi:hypothetical protein